MRPLKFVILSVSFCLVALGCTRETRTAPNVVLVMADDQGWGDVGYSGVSPVQTPVLDEMAKTGFRFDRFYAAAPVCSPTRGSVLTGRHPNRFGCFTWGHTLRPQEVTLAEVLRQAGYVTGHFGKWHLGSVRAGSPVNPGSSGFDEWFSAPNFFDNDPILSREGQAIPTQGESSRVTVEAALEFIRKAARESRPFFAVVWFGSPHRPHEALPRFRDLYSDHPEELRHFYGEITAMDEAIGILRRNLRTLGVADETLFWYCSDNGALPEGTTGGFRGNKGDVYEGGLLVPSILDWPGGDIATASSMARSSTSDIFPTVLEITGAARLSDHRLDGESLLPVLRGERSERVTPLGFWEYPAEGIPTPSKEWMAELYQAQQAGRDPGHRWRLRLDAADLEESFPLHRFPGHSAWISGDWKLHRIADEKGTLKRVELYDLSTSPFEQLEISRENPEQVTLLLEELEEWMNSVVDSLNGREY